MLWGEEDRVVSVKACAALYATLSCEKRQRTFPGCFHELHHEAVQSEVINEIAQWVKTH
jgi:alpha-beta hydrolase superfamily lysophospholipase